MDIDLALKLFVPLAFGFFAIGMLYSIVRGVRTDSTLCSMLLFLGSAFLVFTSVVFYPSCAQHVSMWSFGGLAPFSDNFDPLASIFLVLLGLVGCAVAVFSPAYLKHFKDRFHPGIYWFCFFLFVFAIARLILAGNAISFLVFWELMALSCVALVITDHVSHRARNAALIYLGATRISTSLLLAGFVWMHALTNSWNFADWQVARAEFAAPYMIIFLGLCIKAGIWPFHQWLPYAHPEAPSPVSALMSGVMVKTSVYLMLRLFGSAAGPVQGIAYTAIALGTISSFWGILFALMERDLKRLLAYSTVENVGLITLTLGVALLAKSLGMTFVASIAIAACLFHCINHAIYKSLLFLCSGSVDAAAHTRDLMHLGGLHRGMKWTMVLFFVGSLSICALPPLNGFSSKWLIYQGLFQFALKGGNPVSRAVALAVIGLLSMVGALSVASFSKAFGLGFLGRPRSKGAELAGEPSNGTVCAQVFLAVPCAVLGLCAPYVVRVVEPACRNIVPGYDPSSIFTLPQPQLLIALVVLIPLCYGVALLGNNPRVKRYVTWDCGYGALPLRTLISASSYSRPLAVLFRPILQYKVTSQIKGRDRRHFPELITVEAHTIPLLTSLIYLPAMRAVEALGRGLIRMQTGSIHVHLLYVFATLVILVIIGSRL